ncbi:MAG: serpin family protein [Archangium sp.]|nr:serpin family protein [Archangium sp.]
MFKTRLLSALVAVFALVGCNPPLPGGGEDARSDLQRLTTPAPAGDVEATVRGLNDFTFSLNKRITKPTENFIVSPVSINTALGMASAGAAGTTLDAFRSTLRVNISQGDFHGAMNTLDRELSSRGQGAQGTEGRPFKLSIVNQTFSQTGYKLERSYLDLLAQQYGTGLKLVDFEKQTEAARLTINDFVAVHTSNLIPELLKRGTVTGDTRVVLANAVYFNASWASPFEKTATRPANFTLLSGNTVLVDTLNDSVHSARAATVGGVEVVELPYQKDEVSMLILMPAAGDLASLESSLDNAKLDSFLSALTPQQLDFSMPKFKIDSPSDLSEPLKEEGLAVAFGGDADFSGMTGTRELSISGVLHQAVIKVTEEGTEAAGATAVVFGVTSVPVTRPVKIDRPFMYLIRDRATGTILFMGHVVDPR